MNIPLKKFSITSANPMETILSNHATSCWVSSMTITRISSDLQKTDSEERAAETVAGINN